MNHKKRTKFIVIPILSMVLLSCQSRGQEYQKDSIDLTTLDFNTFNANDFYSNANKDENLKIGSSKQYVEIFDLANGWAEFQVEKSADNDVVGKFGSTKFATMNSMAASDGKLKISNSEAFLTPKGVNTLYLNIVAQYGLETKIDSSSYNKYIYFYTSTWDTKDRIIKLVSLFNPKSDDNLEKINAKIPDETAQLVNERPKTILFICNKANYNEVVHLGNQSNNWSKFK